MSIIRKYFEIENVLYYKTFKNRDEFQNPIFKENKHFIIRKSLDLITPKKDNMRLFDGKIKEGYIYRRSHKKDVIYIYKPFDNKNDFKRSEFEATPLYEMKYKIKIHNRLETFFTEKKCKYLYTEMNNYMENIKEKKTKNAKNISTTKDYIINKNNSYIIGMEDFKKGFILIEKPSTSELKCKSGYKKSNLEKIAEKLWNDEIIPTHQKSDCFTNNIKYFVKIKNEYKIIKKPMVTKPKLCEIIKEILKYLEKVKQSGKKWLYNDNDDGNDNSNDNDNLNFL